VLVSRYKLSLCHTPIKPDLLGFPGIGVFACWLRDHVITRLASLTYQNDLKISKNIILKLKKIIRFFKTWLDHNAKLDLNIT
jgi:hypothetical protein